MNNVMETPATNGIKPPEPPVNPTATETDTPLVTDKDLVLKIAKAYRTEGGSIAWARAYQEHPEWKRQLRANRATNGKAFAIANHFRTQGLLPASPFEKQNHGKRKGRGPSQPQPGNPYAGLTDQSQGFVKVVLPYLNNDLEVDWETLRRKQPDWDSHFPSGRWARETAYRFRTNGTFARFKQAKAGLTKRSLEPREETSAVELTPQVLAMIEAKAKEEVVRILMENRFCSRCGKDHQPNFMAANLAARMQQE
jgi:hypothetical protein